jgi:regulator of protease activity HflC (stomatin/prohibitin superfamily)
MTRFRKNDAGQMSAGAVATITGVIIALIVGIIAVAWWQTHSFGKTDGGHVAVVRNGGPFDNTKIRTVLKSSSGRTNIGLYSSMHNYPTSQRYFTINSSGSGDSDEIINVPTADGVSIGIEGTAYFTVNTDSANNYATLKTFDNKYGTRTFRCKDGSRKHVYSGDEGFSCFLEQIVGPIISNNFRVSIGDLRCADLIASCSLVQNTSAAGVDQSKVGLGNVNLSKIEQEISTSLAADLRTTLQGDYITDVRFNLNKVDLPPTVQQAINTAQASFAQVTQAQAALKRAKIDAETNAARQKGYDLCKVCGDIDRLKALPPGITVYAPGNSNLAVGVK